ncbi:MAG: hypothetical protein IKE42_15945 [Aquamicrobium sp.]|nr:hypothetical protein [Aquamicrobium sp.]
MENKDQERGDASETSWRPLVFDADAYRPYLATFKLTPEQEQELLQTLWSVIVTVVDMRFRLHPIQQANGAAGDIPLDQILAAMLISQEENPNNSNDITVRGEDRPSAEKEDS